ncbi:MAG: hypothetical protein CVU65_15015 [Deltaproteobacteria bacterium HGW-Deltaproteobacteria-22]|jgi:hypothetical protein|nr:MAG: hypothetical protein CVU65_15015 [Deltaproteobacteria bacterium HGW-Deltaproteobacteria-22]
MIDPNEKLDLSSLDPVPGDRSLDAVTALLAGRIISARARKMSLWSTLTAYSKWAAALTTATAAAVLFLALSTPSAPAVQPEPDPDVQLLSWADTDAEPTVSEILMVLGDAP